MSPLLEAAAAITLILGCLTGIGVAIKRIWSGIKRAVKIAETIEKQLSPNGGGSMHDQARIAAEEAVKAREEAVKAREETALVKSDLAEYRLHQAEDAAEKRTLMAKQQHDLTNIRAGQEMLLDEQLNLKQAQEELKKRHEQHRDRNVQHVLQLTRDVRDLRRETSQRDKALGDALTESLDVALAVNDADTTAKEQAVADAMRERLEVTLAVDEAEQET